MKQVTPNICVNSFARKVLFNFQETSSRFPIFSQFQHDTRKKQSSWVADISMARFRLSLATLLPCLHSRAVRSWLWCAPWQTLLNSILNSIHGAAHQFVLPKPSWTVNNKVSKKQLVFFFKQWLFHWKFLAKRASNLAANWKFTAVEKMFDGNCVRRGAHASVKEISNVQRHNASNFRYKFGAKNSGSQVCALKLLSGIFHLVNFIFWEWVS